MISFIVGVKILRSSFIETERDEKEEFKYLNRCCKGRECKGYEKSNYINRIGKIYICRGEDEWNEKRI